MTANDLPQTLPQAPAPAPASVTAPTVAAQDQQAPTTSFGQRWLEHQDSQFLASMRQAVQSDPDTYAESQKLSRQLGVPQETAERDDGYLRKLGRAIQVRNYNLGRTSPTLFRALQDLDFAKKAQDDIESLTLSESVAKAWKIGRLTADRGTYNLMEAQGQLAPEESLWLRGVEQYLRDNREPAGFIPGLAGIMGQVAQTLPNAVEKGIATALGTAAVGAAIPIPEEVVTLPTAFGVGFVSGMAQSAYQVEAGNAWRDMLDAGYNPERAAYAATAVGMVNAALEMAGAKLFTAPVRVALKQRFAAEVRQRIADRVAGNALWSFGRTYASSVGGEIGTEIGQEVTNILGELYAAEGKGDVGPIASRLADIAWQTFEGTALLGVPGAAVSARQTKQRAAMAKEFEAQVRAQFQAAADAKMAQRDPDSLAQFIRDGGNDGQPMVAYVDAATLRDVLRQKDAEATDNGGGLTKSLESRLNEVSPGITDRITEAAAAGGSVELDVAELAAKMGKDADVLTPHLRREPNAPSAAEAEAADKEAQQAGEADTGTDAEKAKAEALDKVRKEIETSIGEAIAKAGASVDPTGRNSASSVITSFVETMSEREGVNPDAFWQQNRVAFEGIAELPSDTSRQGGDRGGFASNAGKLTMLFTRKTDSTTLLHEMGHWFVEVVERIATREGGSQSIRSDFDLLLRRWGVADLASWQALDASSRAKYLEDFTYNFEDYLATGDAPSADLRTVFEKVRAFFVRVYGYVRTKLNAVYRAEFGTDLPALTPELRGVFDRMLASQAAIEQAIAEREGAALFDVQKDAKALGITEDEARLLRVLDEERRAEAVSRVQAEAMRGTRYFESQRRSEESKLRKQAREKRAELREQVQKEVAGQPVYRAMAWINAGEVDNNGTMESAKLDADAVKSILGPDAALIPRSLTKARGQSPDLTAEMFGFRTGHDLLRAIIGALPMEQAVEARVNERMDAEFGSLSDPKKMQQAIEEALHTKAATRYAATILRALLKSTQPTVVLEAAAMSAARAILRSTPISQISPRLYAAAESRAVKAMRKALASGDVKEAIDATRKWLLQHSLTRLSLDVQKEVDKFVEGTVEKVLQPDQKIIDGKRNLDVVMAARAVLGERDLAPGRRFERALNYLESLRELNAAEFESLSASVSALDQFGRKGYRELTLDEFRVLTSTVEALWERAKRVEQYASWDGEMLLRAEVRDRLVQAGIEGGLGKPGTPDFAAEARTWTWDNFLANLRRIESWTISVDGKEGGYWHRYIYRKLAKAYNDYQEISLDGQRWWRDLAATVDNLNGQRINAEAWLGTGVEFRNREHLLGALIHHGNSSNRTAMLDGEGWTEAGWFSFLDAMQENGTLTKADFDAVQAVWDRNDKVNRPLMQGVNRKVYGTYFEEVKAEPFQTRFGTYRGGYASAKIDPNRNADISTRGGFQAIADGEQQFKQSFANAPRGSTIKRTGVRRPRLLSFQSQGQHIDEVARFLAMSEALRDVAGLFTGGPLVDYLNNVAPAAIKSIIAPAVERMARNQIVAPMNGSGGAKIVGSVATWLRRSTSMNALGFNIRNALQQYTGVANAIQYTGAGRFWSSLWSYVTNGTGMANEAMAESKMMRNRLSQEAAKLAEDLALMFDPSLIGKVSRWANHYGYWAQRKTQMQVDVTTWHAARQKSYAELLPTMGPEKARIEAIERADSVVRRSQGARTPLDIASFSGGNAVMQLFTQFSDYPNLVLNQILEQRGLARQAGALLMVLLIPSLTSGAIALSMAGFRAPGSKSKDGDDDKDGRYDDDIAAYLFGQTLRGVGSLLPVAGPAITDAVFAGEQAVDRAQPFAAWSVAQSMLRLIAGGRSAALAWSEGQPTEFGAQDARDVATVFGALGLPMSGPLGRAWSYIEQVDAGRVEPVNGVDYMRGLVNGR